MATIAQMLPTDIGVFEVLDKKGKAEIFKGIPAMDKHLPKILEKDFTSLSKRLSAGQSKRIAKLVVAQKRARDKIRFVMFQLYRLLDASRGTDDQNLAFKTWEGMLYLVLDDAVVAIKEQQDIILSNRGYGEAILRKKDSIIPLEIKQQLEEIKKFDEAFNTRPRFSGWGSSRGANSRFSRGSSRGGWKKSSFKGSGRGRNFSRFRNSFSSRGNYGKSSSSGRSNYPRSGNGGYRSDDEFSLRSTPNTGTFSSFRGRPRGGASK